jgi:hypothetical protein
MSTVTLTKPCKQLDSLDTYQVIVRDGAAVGVVVRHISDAPLSSFMPKFTTHYTVRFVDQSGAETCRTFYAETDGFRVPLTGAARKAGNAARKFAKTSARN